MNETRTQYYCYTLVSITKHENVFLTPVEQFQNARYTRAESIEWAFVE